MTRRPLNPIRRYRIRRLRTELENALADRRAHLIANLDAADVNVICLALRDRARLFAGCAAGARAEAVHAKICETPR